jgi:RNA polymerase sigma factor (sigma-70 family)
MEKKNNINENIAALIIKFKAASNKDIQNKAFCEILKLCEPIIKMVIRKLKYKPPITFEELEHEAEVTLFKLLKKYEVKENGPKFSNYAATYIENSLINYIRKTQNILYISKNQFEKNSKIKKFINEYEIEHDAMPSDDEIMKETGMSKNDILNYRETINNEYYDIEEIDDIEDIDAIIEVNNKDPFKDERLNILFNEINPDEQKFLLQLIENDFNYAKVAKIEKCSRENIRQKYERLITKMKKISHEKGLM